MRRWWSVVTIGLLAASCSTGDDAAVRVVRSDTDAFDGGSRPDVEGDVLPPVDSIDESHGTDGFDQASYSFEFRVEIGPIGEPTDRITLQGAVDPASERGVVGSTVRDYVLSEDGSTEAIDPDLRLDQVVIGEQSYVRGLIPEMGYPTSIDPAAWYESTAWVHDAEALDVLGSVRTGQEMRTLLAGVEATVVDTETGVGESAFQAVLDDEQADSLRSSGSVFQALPYTETVEVTVEFDSTDHVSTVELSGSSSVESFLTVVHIADVGEPVELPEIVDPLSVWEIEADAPAPDIAVEIDTTPDVIVRDLEAPLRISTNGSYLVEGFVDRTFVIEADGDVLRIIGGNIFTGASGYTTWNLGPQGRVEIERLIAELDLVGNDERSGSGSGGLRGTISGGGLVTFQIDHLEQGAAHSPKAVAFLDLIDMLDDPNGLDGIAATEPEPWVPSHLAIQVGDDYNPQYYTTTDIEWPFDRSIDDMVNAGAGDDERYVCLAGAEAALAWRTLMVDGVNNARLPVTDGLMAREIGLTVSYPGYHVSGNPCDRVDDVSGGVDLDLPPPDPIVPLPQELVDELLITASDLGPEWSQGLLTSVGPPPQISSCPNATDRPSGDAVSEFDRWIERTLTLNGPGGRQMSQFVGEAPPGSDVDTVVDAIGPYVDCAQPLLEVGITDFASGDLTELPERVTAGSYWTFTDASGRHVLVADIAVDSRYVMVLSLSAADPLPLAALDEIVEVAADGLARFDLAVAACDQLGGTSIGRCG